MAFTSLTVTGTITRNGAAGVGYTVELELSSPITDGVSEILGTVSGVCDSSGSFSIAGVTANDDTTTLPVGTYYKVKVRDKRLVVDWWDVVIPKASAPSVDLLALPRLGNPPSPVYPYVSSLTAADGTITVGGTATKPTVKVTAGVFESLSHKDAASGYAGLDSSGLLKVAELPPSVVTSSSVSKPLVDVEKIWLQNYGADNTGATYSDAAFALAITAAQTFLNENQSGRVLISGLAGVYKLGQYTSLVTPVGIAFGNFGGGARYCARFWFPNETNLPTAIGYVAGPVTAGDTTLALIHVKNAFAPVTAGHPQPIMSYGGTVLTYTGITGSGLSVTLTGVAGITAPVAALLPGNLAFGNAAVMCSGAYGRDDVLDRTIEVWGPQTGSMALWVPGSTLNGAATLPQATIPLVATTNFPTTGGQVMLTGTSQVITYTGVSGSSLTGCTGGTGTIASGTSTVYITPPQAMDGVLVPHGGKINCAVNGFRHASVFASDHEQWGKDFYPSECYSYIACEAPINAGWANIDSGDQLIHAGIDLHGAYFTTFWVSAFNALVNPKILGGNTAAFSPFVFWKEPTAGVTGAEPFMFLDGIIKDLNFEAAGLGVFGSPDGASISGLIIDNCGVTWNGGGATAPAGAPTPLGEFACNCQDIIIRGGTMFPGAPSSYPNTPWFYGDQFTGQYDYTINSFANSRAVIGQMTGAAVYPYIDFRCRGARFIGMASGTDTAVVGDLVEAFAVQNSAFPSILKTARHNGGPFPPLGIVVYVNGQVIVIATDLTWGVVNAKVNATGDIAVNTYVRSNGSVTPGTLKSAYGLGGVIGPIVGFAVTADSGGFASILLSPYSPVPSPKVGTVTQSATPAINTDTLSVASITGLAQAITSMTTNLTGTAVDGQTLIVRITDNGTARAITWGSSFEASTVALPTTTVISTMLMVGFAWNAVTSKWRCVAVA